LNTELKAAFSKHWYLGGAAAGCVVVAFFMGGKPIQGPDSIPKAEASIVATVESTVQSTRPPIFATQDTQEDQLRASIAEYKHKIYEEKRTEDSDQDMMRLANILYSNFQEFEEASTYYEMLMVEYPDFEMKSTVYQNLSACYKFMEKIELERGVYRRMAKEFPKDSVEYEYAVFQLKQR